MTVGFTPIRLGAFRFFFKLLTLYHCHNFLKKNLNASRLSEHPSVRGKNVKKFRWGIIGCKYKTSSWHLNGFPDGSNIGSPA